MMEKYTDEIIKTVLHFLPKEKKDWELLGFINKDRDIFTFGNDSKIIGRLFEVIVTDALLKTSKKLGYELYESQKQTVYPDFYFLKPDGRRIAIDIKTTYRQHSKKKKLSKFLFTGGSYTSFMRNGTKNISGNYSDYEKHYILGILYSRVKEPSIGKKKFEDLHSIIPAYSDPEVFIQEKFRICGEKKGSGNTDNIGTIKANSIDVFAYGAGPFAFLGIEAFHDYWSNYPKYKDSQAHTDSLYTDIYGYIRWLENKQNKPELAEIYREKYKEYLTFKKSQGWD